MANLIQLKLVPVDAFIFGENVFDKKEKIKFFNKGISKNWVGNLNKDIQIEIEKEFNKEMKYLGYL